MRILIDLQGAQNNSRSRGIGRFTRAFAQALIRHPGDHDIYLLLNGLFADQIKPVMRGFEGLIPPERIIRFEAPGPTAEVDGVVLPHNTWRLGASELLYEKFLTDLDMDAVIMCTLFEGAQDDTIISLLDLPRRHITAIVLHDLIPLTDPQQYIGWEPSAVWYYRKLESLRRADVLLAVSESAKREAIELDGFAPGRVAVVGQAAADELSGPIAPLAERQPVLDRHGITRPYVMHMSAYEPRKNFQGLIAAFAALPPAMRAAHQLVLVCKLNDASRGELERAVELAGLAPEDVIRTDFVTDDELAALYASAKLFAFPSFHEGFGLPALEAMQCGTPVIGSNLSSMPEVIGREDALFDPYSTEDITRLLEKALGDDAFLNDLRAHAVEQSARFSWEITAGKTIAAIEAAHAARAAVPSRAQLVAQHDGERIIPLIAQVKPAAPPSDEDYARTATTLAANEATARRTRAQVRPGEAIAWRMEGPFDSSYSLALVNREAALALADLGHKPALHSSEGGGDFAPSAEFLKANPPVAAFHGATAKLPPSKADIVSRNLYPPRVADMTGRVNALHGYAWEETGFPQDWAEDFNRHLDLIMVVSRHVEKVLIDNGVHVPIAVTGNGVDHWEKLQPYAGYRLSARGFRFLHVSSCFPRKGIDELLDAYGEAFSSGDDVSLVIKTFDNPHNKVRDMIAQRYADDPSYPDVVLLQEELSDASLKALFSQCDVLVAPSRAEGYGLPFAEAMLSGLPVITTGWSGQMDFCDPADTWLVDYSFERARTHIGLHASAWARADTAALATAMREAHGLSRSDRAQRAAAGRARLLAEHRWEDVAARMVDALDDLPLRKAARSAPRIGWVSTWNARCGIATYSEHLVAHMPGPVTVFAAHTDQMTRADDEHCIRSWTASKDRNDLSHVAEEAARLGIDLLVIQFNYAFYNHDELAALIDSAKARGCTVVMMLHSTRDPVVEIPGAELFRFADQLRRCDRLLVHSIVDLNRLKAIGLIDNVALFPHGALMPAQPAATKVVTDDMPPLVASYGFALPDKGLIQLIDAAALLRDRGQPVRLRMVNAAFPAPVSTNLIMDLRTRIAKNKLGNLVELITDFLPDEESLAHLAPADLILFAYQQSGESASGAVRYGMASGRPVAVTPLAIFDDVADATFRLPGTDAESIANGIAATLEAIADGETDAMATLDQAASWRAQHDYDAIGRRLHNICLALHNRSPRRPLELAGSSRLLGASGLAMGHSMMLAGARDSDAPTRFVPLDPGDYVLRLDGDGGDAIALTVSSADGTVLAQAPMSKAGLGLLFTLRDGPGVKIALTGKGQVAGLRIVPAAMADALPDADRATGPVTTVKAAARLRSKA